MAPIISSKKSIKQIESFLQELDGFDNPKVQLEQYMTPPHIASLVLSQIHHNGDIEGKIVADLGCGSGMLSMGSIFCGARMVYGFDIDGDALKGTLVNVAQLFGDNDTPDEDEKNLAHHAFRACDNINLVQVDIATEDKEKFWQPWTKMFDTVLMNPPFGTKQNQGLDMTFLSRAIYLASKSVYSLHKSSTRDYIHRKIQHWGLRGRPIAQLRYNLDNTYKFHRKRTVDVDVDLWHINCS